MIFEVKARKPDSPYFDAESECPHFQQTRFWAEFKAAHGWNMIALDIAISRKDGGSEAEGGAVCLAENDDGAKTCESEKRLASESESNCESESSRIFVLVRSFARSLFSIAYVPMYPLFSQALSAEAFCELVEKIAFEIRAHLPKNTICVRFDPALEFDSVSARDDFVREVKRFASSDGKSLKKNFVDIQPPDTSIVNLDHPEEEILSSMKSKWRYNIKLASRKGVKIERFGAQDFSENSAQNSGDASEVSARDALLESLSKKVDEFYEVYRITSARDGIAIHSKQYYLDLLEKSAREKIAGKDIPLVWLYVARHEGDILGAIMTLVTKKEGVYLYGASSNTKRNLMPNFLLQWTAMRDARAFGAKSYDLYGIPPTDDESHPMHGLFLFKTGFGGRNVHRVGTFDVPLNGVYAFCSFAERARAWWHKKFLKKICGR